MLLYRKKLWGLGYFTMYSFPCSGDCGHKGWDGTVLILGSCMTSTTELLDNSWWSHVVRGRNTPFCCYCQSLTLGLACNYSVTLPILAGPNIKWFFLSYFKHIGITGNDGQSTRGIQKIPGNSTNINLFLLPFPFRFQNLEILDGAYLI